ncbi:MAG: hypothetical protein GY715_18395 [Planctomycetes bacterium]|nr:hypothetical protein [Planctomycetota bacterium]
MNHSDPPNHDHDASHPNDPPTGADDDGLDASGTESEVRKILSTVGGQLEMLRTIQVEQDAHAATLDERERIIIENERSLAEERRKLIEWRRELDSGEADSTTAHEAEAEAEQLRARVAELELAEKTRAPSAPPGDMSSSMRITAMQQRIFRLEEELEAERAKSTEAASAPAPAADADAAAHLAGLREKAVRLAEVAQHLKCRQGRLHLLRRLLSDESRARRPVMPAAQKLTHEDFEKRAAQIRKLEHARQELTDERRLLVVREKRMVRRWARARAVVVAGWFVFIAAIAAGASWIAVDRYVPATVSASVTLEAKAKHRARFTEEDAQLWQTWHVDLLRSESFRRTVAARMEERRLDAYRKPRDVARMLDEGLSVDAGVTREITLTLAGTDQKALTAFLDILATTLASESLRQARNREDSTWAVVRGERKEGSRLLYSVVNETPIADQRLHYLGPVFGAVMVLMLVIIAFTYGRLMRVKREFDDDGTLFDPAAGPPAQASADSYTIG